MQRVICPVGGMLQVDDDIRIGVHGRLGDRVTFEVTAPKHCELTLDDVALHPAPLDGGGCWYLFSLLNIRAFLVGGIVVHLVASPGAQEGSGEDAAHLVIVGARSIRRLHVDAGAADDTSGGRRPSIDERLLRL